MARIAFMKVENRVGAPDPFQRKLLHQFLAREDFFAVRRRPAQQRQEITKGGRNESAIAIGGERNYFAVLALGKLCLIRRQNQRQMSKQRNVSAESLIE